MRDPLDQINGYRIIWADDLDGRVLLWRTEQIIVADSGLTLSGVAASVAAALPAHPRLQAVE